MRGRLRKTLLFTLAVAVLGVLIYRSRSSIGLKDFDWSQLRASITHANVWLLLLSTVAIYVAYALRAARWVRFSRYLGSLSFPSVYRSTLVGFTAIFLLGRAGEPIRPLLIARKDGVPVSATFGIYILERIFDLAATLVVAGLSLLLFPGLLSAERGASDSTGFMTAIRASGMVMLLALPVAVVFLVYFRLHGAEAYKRRLERLRRSSTTPGWRLRVACLIDGFGDGLQAIRNFGDLAAAVAYSAAHWALVVWVYLWICQAFGGRLGELSLSAAMLVLAFSMVGSTIQLPAVGGGSQAACFLAFTLVLGVEKEPAAAASIVLWLITFAASSLAGVPLLVREGWSMGELRRLARAEAEAEDAGTHLSAVEHGAAIHAKEARR